MLNWLLFVFLAGTSTVSIMGKYVDNERIAGERRMDALFAKKIDVLCPGYNQKGMSLCVRQHIRSARIETASGFTALSHFVTVAGNQDLNAKIYDEPTALIMAAETLTVLQDQLKKENMVCSKLQPSGPQNLLAIKQVCSQEEEQFREQQGKNKKYIQKQLAVVLEKIAKNENKNLKQWLEKKKIEIESLLAQKFDKTFFTENEYQITAKDILQQHHLTIKTSCDKLSVDYKKKFNTQNPCELAFSQIFLNCVDMPQARKPSSVKEKEIIEMVQKPLPCFYVKMQQYLTQQEQ